MISPKALALMLRHEGLDQPSLWPGGNSGISIGHGYDLGQATALDFMQSWGRWLTDRQYSRLAATIGQRGEVARKLAPKFDDIRISKEAADWVFTVRSLPRFERLTRECFPGFDALPLDAQGALVSLVYNRGTDMGTKGEPSWDRRKEMRAVRDAVAAGNLRAIADAIYSMRRLWIGSDTPGLVTRREEESALVASCIKPDAPCVGVS